MKCPNCKAENNESAKFCKKCGTALEKSDVNHETLINSGNGEKKSDNTKILIVALIVVAVVLAGAFIYLQGFGNGSHSQDSNSHSGASNSASQADSPSQQSSSQSSGSNSANSNSMKIISGSFSTGSELSDLTYANIFVGNLAEDVDEKILKDIFSTFGVVLSTKIMRDPDTGLSKHYGFVSFDNFDSSDKAIQKMKGQYISGKPIEVEYAFKKDTKGERHGSVAERILAANRPVNIMGKGEDEDYDENDNKEPTFDLNKALNNFKNSNIQFSSNNKNVKVPNYPPNK